MDVNHVCRFLIGYWLPGGRLGGPSRQSHHNSQGNAALATAHADQDRSHSLLLAGAKPNRPAWHAGKTYAGYLRSCRSYWLRFRIRRRGWIEKRLRPVEALFALVSNCWRLRLPAPRTIRQRLLHLVESLAARRLLGKARLVAWVLFSAAAQKSIGTLRNDKEHTTATDHSAVRRFLRSHVLPPPFFLPRQLRFLHTSPSRKFAAPNAEARRESQCSSSQPVSRVRKHLGFLVPIPQDASGMGRPAVIFSIQS